ncbi:MAG: nicotinate (nicotinamide) nucleotide adenylyltransferase [Desulfobulbaceae bacterium]|uniref:Probable nicotinate-nucleotide adenylyltransferase n=1 Tax=Candidatus Desulfatifera sulfidica TaxID=2841691 RepID=A0A8J6NAS6_9BACT|nr:nicotinate (nicotinamide) nucleotide adenylyltransferase [Candidatus Desulfatifera sulfidica]
MMRKVGLLGGTFDPVHNGHLHLARVAREYCVLDEVWFQPAVIPPHKDDETLTSFAHRAQMIELALFDYPEFQLSRVEAGLPVPSYTIDTLNYLQEQQGKSTEFYFIIGADAFLEIQTWKSCDQVLSAVHWIVCGRGQLIQDQIRTLAQKLSYEDLGRDLYDPRTERMIFLPSDVPPDISSSLIRQRLASRQSVQGLIPPRVHTYLCEQHLFGC